MLDFAALVEREIGAAVPRTPDEWAEANRILPPGSAEPGPMRLARTPYVVPILRAFSRWEVVRIVFTMARQMAKTSGVVFNVLGHRLDDEPCPCLYVGPTEDNIRNVVEPKIQHMLEHTPSLWVKTARGQLNKKTWKLIAGVPLRLAWAGSDSQLKADSMGLAFVDEIDGIEQQAKEGAGEGNVIDMVEAICKTYPESKLGITSTPTLGHAPSRRDERTGLEHWEVSEDVTSAVWRYWQEGSRHEWAWPCPHCLAYFVPRSVLLHPVRDVSADEAEERGCVICPNCGSEILDRHRDWANRRGVMVAPGQRVLEYSDEWGAYGSGGPGPMVQDMETAEEPQRLVWGDYLPQVRSRSYASFWVSGLATFSVKTTYGYIASKLVRALASGDPERIRGTYNTDLGELYRVIGEAPDWAEVQELAYGYALGQALPRVTTLTAGVDVQANRLVYVIRGWVPERERESYLVGYGELWGDTDKAEVWGRLRDDILDTEHGGLRIARMAIDSGYRRNAVYNFASDNSPRAIACKGQATMDESFKSVPIEINYKGRKRKMGLHLWHVNSDWAKSWVHSRIGWPSDQPGAWHLPDDISEGYCKQIAAEARRVNRAGKVIWEKLRVDNHFLDAEALAYLAANTIKITKAERKAKAPLATTPPREPEQWIAPSDEWLRRR